MEHERANAPKQENMNASTRQNINAPTHKRMCRLTTEIPEDLFLLIHDRAGRLRTNKKDIVEELLRAGVRETANFIRLRKELNTPIDALVKAYKEEFSKVKVEDNNTVFSNDELNSVVLERID